MPRSAAMRLKRLGEPDEQEENKVSNLITKRHNFSNCPIKSKARRRLVIEPCKHVFGPCLPKDLQYWSLCAQCISPSGQVIKGCELDQMIKCGLIDNDQFHGVDFDEQTTEGNQIYDNSSWYFDHLEDAISQSVGEGNFHPALIHIDTTWMTERAVNLFVKVLDMVSYCGCDIPVVSLGVVLEAYTRVETSNDLFERICKSPTFRKIWNEKKWELWRSGEKVITWPGTGKMSRTEMVGITLIPAGDRK